VVLELVMDIELKGEQVTAIPALENFIVVAQV
jgi:hypothetical protein